MPVARAFGEGVEQEPFAARTAKELDRDIEVGVAPCLGVRRAADSIAEIGEQAGLGKGRRRRAEYDLAVHPHPHDAASRRARFAHDRPRPDRASHRCAGKEAAFLNLLESRVRSEAHTSELQSLTRTSY